MYNRCSIGNRSRRVKLAARFAKFLHRFRSSVALVCDGRESRELSLSWIFALFVAKRRYARRVCSIWSDARALIVSYRSARVLTSVFPRVLCQWSNLRGWGGLGGIRRRRSNHRWVSFLNIIFIMYAVIFTVYYARSCAIRDSPREICMYRFVPIFQRGGFSAKSKGTKADESINLLWFVHRAARNEWTINYTNSTKVPVLTNEIHRESRIANYEWRIIEFYALHLRN